MRGAGTDPPLWTDWAGRLWHDVAMRTITAVLVFSGVLALGACTPESPVSPPRSTTAPAESPLPAGGQGTIPCDSVIGSAVAPPPGLTVVVDDVALPLQRALDPSPTGGSGSPRLFAKQGLLVRAGAQPELRVPADWESRAWIGWGNPAGPASFVTVSACSPSGSDPWIAFAGGYYVDEPACVPIVVRSAGRETTVRVGVGVACR